jgi:hypothetical protein
LDDWVIISLVQMKAWDFLSGRMHNAGKIRSLQKNFANTDPKVLWQYLVFLHKCNFNGRLTVDDTNTVLKMLQGPMYNEAAFIAMETPLLNSLIALRSELEDKFHKKYWEHRRRWGEIVRQMQRARESSHRELDPNSGRANEYFVAARNWV